MRNRYPTACSAPSSGVDEMCQCGGGHDGNSADDSGGDEPGDELLGLQSGDECRHDGEHEPCCEAVSFRTGELWHRPSVAGPLESLGNGIDPIRSEDRELLRCARACDGRVFLEAGTFSPTFSEVRMYSTIDTMAEHEARVAQSLRAYDRRHAAAVRHPVRASRWRALFAGRSGDAAPLRSARGTGRAARA